MASIFAQLPDNLISYIMDITYEMKHKERFESSLRFIKGLGNKYNELNETTFSFRGNGNPESEISPLFIQTQDYADPQIFADTERICEFREWAHYYQTYDDGETLLCTGYKTFERVCKIPFFKGRGQSVLDKMWDEQEKRLDNKCSFERC